MVFPTRHKINLELDLSFWIQSSKVGKKRILKLAINPMTGLKINMELNLEFSL